jgi:Cell wall-active antibiotics response 4TMS YvqF
VTVHDYPPAPPPAPPIQPPRRAAVPPASVPAGHSRLARRALSLMVFALGVTGIVDLSGAQVSGSAYIAVALVVVGAALLVGAWYGRARWLIALGLVLTVALPIATTAEAFAARNESVTWRPTSIDQLDRSYTTDVGTAVLDLSGVDFGGRDFTMTVKVGLGDLAVIVPANVDVRADARVDVGNADVFGTHWGGIGQPARTVVDDGADGPGGGTLVIHATTDVGNVEVRR